MLPWPYPAAQLTYGDTPDKPRRWQTLGHRRQAGRGRGVCRASRASWRSFRRTGLHAPAARCRACAWAFFGPAKLLSQRDMPHLYLPPGQRRSGLPHRMARTQRRRKSPRLHTAVRRLPPVRCAASTARLSSDRHCGGAGQSHSYYIDSCWRSPILGFRPFLF